MADLATRVMLALLLATAGPAQVDERCPGTALDRSPKLLSSLEPLKGAAREEGYRGRLMFGLTVTETGSVRDPEVTYPPQFADSDKIEEHIRQLRFCPAVRHSRYAEVRYTFDIELR
jgi:hypothetical protein